MKNDIAIIGIGLKFPKSDNLEQFWQHLVNESSLITEVPGDRWDKSKLYGNPRKGNHTNSIWGGFIDYADCFDADFFNISPREAQNMDPQQRFALELTWKALEDGGYRPSMLKGSKTGVFMGACHWDYSELMAKENSELDAYFPTGTAYSIISNRISYYYDFTGPSITNDTACSSSLVSVYQAVKSLQDKECDYAIAGGVNLIWSSNHFVAFSKNGMLSKDGKCKAFDDDANGYVRGEGGAVLLLKPLDKAIEDNDAVYGVIKGIGINHGGKTNSLTVTNPVQQARLISDIYKSSNIPPSSVSYIEAHGTGTPLGDPIEISGLKMAFEELHDHYDLTPEVSSCGIGSVKTNIGHLEGAAGVAGMVKVLASMKNKVLPATINFNQLNSLVSLDESPFYIVDKTQEWHSDSESPKRAGVSSFGFGGTNAHVLIEEFIQDENRQSKLPSGPQIIPLSAKTSAQLREQVLQLHNYIEGKIEPPEAEESRYLDLNNLAYTLQLGRDSMKFRVAFIVNSLYELLTLMSSYMEGNINAQLCTEGIIEQANSSQTYIDQLDINVLVNNWIEQGQFLKISKSWTKGDDIDWSVLYKNQKPTILRLPNYPFARKKHWFKKAEDTSLIEGAHLHPLIHQNISTFNQQRFYTRLSDTEFFIKDHLINEMKTLPGVCYLEMIREAISHSFDDNKYDHISLLNVVWIKPIIVKESYADVFVDFSTELKGQISFAIKSGIDDQQEINCQGVVVLSTQKMGSQSIDINQLKDELHEDKILPSTCYSAFRASNIAHGTSFQAVRKIYSCDEKVLAQLQLPKGVLSTIEDYQLHPSLMDASLQIALAMHMKVGIEEPLKTPALPFALEELHVIQPCTENMWVLVQLVGEKTLTKIQKFDIQLLNSKGDLCVNFKGFSSKTNSTILPDQKQNNNDVAHQNLLFNTVKWTAQEAIPLEENLQVVTKLIAIDIDSNQLKALDANIIDIEVLSTDPHQEEVVKSEQLFLAVFKKIQESLRSTKSKQLLIVLIPDTDKRHRYAAISGLLKTTTIENPSFSTRFLSISDLETTKASVIANCISLEFKSKGNGEIHYDAEKTRHKKQLVEVAFNENKSIKSNLRAKGVYWITGGLGGLATLLTHADQFKGSTVILSGRSELSLENKDLLNVEGVKLEYIKCDIANYQDVKALISTIKSQFAQLNGVFHAAGVIRDAFIIHKTSQEIHDVFAPKIQGTYNIDSATKHLQLDFIVLFSSVASTLGNMGQADYSGACTFMDAYSHHRNKLVEQGLRFGRTISINWPLWKEGGMQMDPVNLDRLKTITGMVPLETNLGVNVLFAMCDGAHEQIGVTQGDQEAIRMYLDVVNEQSSKQEVIQKSLHNIEPKKLHQKTVQLLKEHLGAVIKRDPDEINKNEALEEYGLDSIIIVELTTTLEKYFGSLSKTLFFEYINLHELANYFVDEFSDKLPEILGLNNVNPDSNEQQSITTEKTEIASVVSLVNDPSEQPKSGHHDIAIIGVSGKYPGADTMDEFWKVLCEGKDCLSPIPNDRWNHEQIYHDERDVLGKSTIKNGSFIRDIDKFDPRYFKISKHQAELMSPEVRLFLQVGVEALEDSGYSKEYIKRKYDGDVGVIVGTMSNHYNLYGFENMLTRGAQASGSYTGTIPNMLSYYYGFTGPSFFLDTMCSASSACIDQAVHMLRSGQCKMAVAGGINLLLHPYNMISSSQEHFTTKSSKEIKSYGLGADGTILGEGLGAVILKPLAEAEKDGDQIYGIIKGTAITNAGIRNGFTVPNPKMQAKAIEKAIEDAGISPRSISYLEGHGSGTSLGDPIEIKGLDLAFKKYTSDLQFCPIGSVKSNIGHLLAASGIAGITKVLLQFKHKQITASLHSEQLNPGIHFKDTPFYVARNLQAWERPVNYPRRAGVTSIGAGGVNSHIILEEYTASLAQQELPGVPLLFVFCAMTKDSMSKQLKTFTRYLHEKEDQLNSIAYTLQVGKNELPCRTAIISSNKADLIQTIETVIAGIEQEIQINQAQKVLFTNSILEYLEDIDPSLIQTATEKKDLLEIASCWVQGESIDWDMLWAMQPVRVSLPSYSFEKVRCWYTSFDDAPNVMNPIGFNKKIHPFLGSNESTVEMFRFTTQIRAIELLDYVLKRNGDSEIISSFIFDVALAIHRELSFDNSMIPVEFKQIETPNWEKITSLLYTIKGDPKKSMDCQVYMLDENQAKSLLLDFKIASRNTIALNERLDLPILIDLANPIISTAETLYQSLSQSDLLYEPYLKSIHSIHVAKDNTYIIQLKRPELQQDHYKNGVIIDSGFLAAIDQSVQYLGKQLGMLFWNQLRLFTAESIQMSNEKHAIKFLVLEQVTTDTSFTCNARFVSQDGSILVEFKGLSYRSERVLSPIADKVIPRNKSKSKDVKQHIQEQLKEVICSLLKFNLDDIDLNTQFYSYGFDSISFIKFSQLLGKTFNINISPSIFYDCENIDELSVYLQENFPLVNNLVHDTDAKVDNWASEKIKPSLNETVTTLSEHPPETNNDDDVVAIIGASGRFPGAEDLDTFWNNLINRVDTVSDFPQQRHTDYYTAYLDSFDFPKKGGFITADAFDAEFFNISRLEAEYMDPQHRIALETVWHTIENAGYVPSQLSKNTGLFFGVSGNDYLNLLNSHKIIPDAFLSTGTSHAMLANRISYLLNIHGPSEPVDTACSSSLVAVHRAVECIKNGQCDMAIAGGVNLNLSVETFASANHAGMLSPNGKCQTFSKNADGYVRGEGVGAILLKRLSQAEKDGDTILGLVRGSAINHGGKANSITAPNSKAQSALIKEALGPISPSEIGYVETHGTGTSLGDPIEIDALTSAFKDQNEIHQQAAYCGLGALKTNIGHMEAAAGIGGLLKVIMSIKHQTLAPNLHCDQQSQYIHLEGGPFFLLNQAKPWKPLYSQDGKLIPLRAGVSSFGFGGVNAHTIIEQYVPRAKRQAEQRSTNVFVLSAKNREELNTYVKRMHDYIFIDGKNRLSKLSLTNICYTLQTGRIAQDYRLAITCKSLADLDQKIDFLLNDKTTEQDIFIGKADKSSIELIQFADQTKVDFNLSDNDLSRLAASWVKGSSINWKQLFNRQAQRVELPGYPFNKESYWLPKTTMDVLQIQPASTRAQVSESEEVIDKLLTGELHPEAAVEHLYNQLNN